MAYPPDELAADKSNTTSTHDDADHPDHHNDLATAVNDIVDELGPNPSGSKPNVETRFSVLDVAAGLIPPLLAEAELLYRATSVRHGYVEGDPWPNEGTLGDDYDAIVGDGVPELDIGGGNPVTDLAGFHIPSIADAELGVPLEHGFEIPGAAVLRIPVGASRTFMLATTPEDRADVRFMWRYDNSSLPISPDGWVLENVIDDGTGNPRLIAAAYDGSMFIGTKGTRDRTSRQIITFVVDDDAGTATAWRNGVPFDVLPSTSLDSWDGAEDTGVTVIGGGQTIHAFAAWPRALTPDEILKTAYSLVAPSPVGYQEQLIYEHPDDVVDDAMLFDPFGTGTLDLGVGGTATLRVKRVGDRVRGVLYVTFGTGADLGSGGIITIDNAFLPVPPRATPNNFAEPGGFGYISRPETAPGAGDGYILAISSAATYFGFGEPIVTFIRVTSGSLVSGIDALWLPGSPIPNAALPGAKLQVAIDYEVFE